MAADWCEWRKTLLDTCIPDKFSLLNQFLCLSTEGGVLVSYLAFVVFVRCLFVEMSHCNDLFGTKTTLHLVQELTQMLLGPSLLDWVYATAASYDRLALRTIVWWILPPTMKLTQSQIEAEESEVLRIMNTMLSISQWPTMTASLSFVIAITCCFPSSNRATSHVFACALPVQAQSGTSLSTSVSAVFHLSHSLLAFAVRKNSSIVQRVSRGL